MDEQILKDFIVTAQEDNYNWELTISKFPELKDYDLQILKDYVATAEDTEYDYDKVNGLFPEFNFTEKKKRRITAYFSRGRYGIHYTRRGRRWIFGFFKGKN